MKPGAVAHQKFMRAALRLARRGQGATSPNPIVGALLVKNGRIIGRGWHRRAGCPHAEIEAINDAVRRKMKLSGATLYVTLEPCSTHGRTPPCTEAIPEAGIRKVVIGATDPNPKHAGRGLALLRAAGIQVETGMLAREIERANEAFRHWIVEQTPFVILKSALTLDGKIATSSGQSQWITNQKSRALGMQLRRETDAILVGINTVLRDNPRLTPRPPIARLFPHRRIVLDTQGRTPLNARVLREQKVSPTIIVVGRSAPRKRIERLAKKATVWRAPLRAETIDLAWVLKRLGSISVTSLLVEGGGKVNGAFLEQNLVQRIAFFYGPLVLGDAASPRAVAGNRITPLGINLVDFKFRVLDDDLFLSARIEPPAG
jgi:diaminohydroxyphosphoribosylaminopyrimidine deaminase/5-amino-6-(5-phosphoribosylamino)uracil reductase